MAVNWVDEMVDEMVDMMVDELVGKLAGEMELTMVDRMAVSKVAL